MNICREGLEMTWSELGIQLAMSLLPVVAALLIALIGYGVTYLKKQTERLNNEIARRALHDALAEAEIVATDAIRATNQTLVNDLKAKAADGKLTRAEAITAMNTAKEYFLRHITSGSKEVLEAALGPVTEWLESYLEAKLGAEKAMTIQQQVAATAAPLSSGQTK